MQISEVNDVNFGLILLEEDKTLEKEWADYLPKEKNFFTVRIPSPDKINSKALEEISKNLGFGSLSLRKTSKMEVVAFACTSARSHIGYDTLTSTIRLDHPDSVITDPVTALFAAVRILNIKKIGLISPYIPEVSKTLIKTLEEGNLTVVNSFSFEEEVEEKVASIPQSKTFSAIVETGKKRNCDAIFVSCTNLPTFSIIKKAENIIKKPVLSSNLVLLWHFRSLTIKNYFMVAWSLTLM